MRWTLGKKMCMKVNTKEKKEEETVGKREKSTCEANSPKFQPTQRLLWKGVSHQTVEWGLNPACLGHRLQAAQGRVISQLRHQALPSKGTWEVSASLG